MSDLAAIQAFLDYHPETGIFTWKISPAKNVKAGDVAGTVNEGGYRRICIKGKTYLVHRLVWLFSYGEWPKQPLDHIDQDKLNNVLSNLRIANSSENGRNQQKRYGASQFKGVVWHKQLGKWQAGIRISPRKHKHLGVFDDEQIAAHEYNKAAVLYHGEFACLNPVGEERYPV